MLPSVFKRPRCSECGMWLKVGEDRQPIPCRAHPAAAIELVKVCRKCLTKRLDVDEKMLDDKRFPVLHGWYVCAPCMEAEIAWWKRHAPDYFRETPRNDGR